MLEISIPKVSDENDRKRRNVSERLKSERLKSDASGWFSVIYQVWNPEKVAVDLSYRIMMLEIEYEHALYDKIFDDCVLKEMEAIEDVIMEEFDRIEFKVKTETRDRLFELLESLESIKVTYLNQKSI